jgi:hypothetical protein
MASSGIILIWFSERILFISFKFKEIDDHIQSRLNKGGEHCRPELIIQQANVNLRCGPLLRKACA